MRIEKQMTHQASQKTSKQWKHLKTDYEPLYSENHAAEAFIPSGNAARGSISMDAPTLQPLFVDLLPQNSIQGSELKLVSPISAPQTIELRLVTFKYQ